MRTTEEATCLGTVDVEALRDFVARRGPEVWHFKCDAINTLPDCTRIILRHSRDYNFDFHDIVDWPMMESFRPVVQPILDRVCEVVNKHRITAAFVANLPAGKVIYPHIDRGEFLETPSRIHVPLQTNDEVFYMIGGCLVDDEIDPDDVEGRMAQQIASKRYHMKVGEIWEIDNCTAHSVRNGGTTDRWHLVVNVG